MTMEMVEGVTIVSAIGFVVMTLFFWVRGVTKSSRSDLLVGILLLIVSCFALMATATSCEVLNMIGLVLIVFGIVSHMMSRKTEETSKVIRKSSLRAIGTGCIFLGVLMQLHA
ncbi:MAG: hypothetical protein WC708_11545 [Lentisphaeria bacterium]